MNRLDGNARWGVGVGLAIGLLVGVGMMFGAICALTVSRPSAQQISNASLVDATFPDWKLHASASHGSETLAIATGSVDEEAEGAFFLDYLTGELQCYVVDPRLGKFTGLFKTNVIKDLPAEKGKKPAYVMATGTWTPVRGAGVARPSNCIVYVADANTGYFAAYYFPWVKGARGTGQLQAAPMLLLGTGKARELEVRE